MKNILMLVVLSLFSSTTFAQSSSLTAEMQLHQLNHESTLRYIDNATKYSTACLNDLTKGRKPNFKKYHDSCATYMRTTDSWERTHTAETKENAKTYTDYPTMVAAQEALRAIGFDPIQYQQVIDKRNGHMEANSKMKFYNINGSTCVVTSSSARCF